MNRWQQKERNPLSDRKWMEEVYPKEGVWLTEAVQEHERATARRPERFWTDDFRDFFALVTWPFRAMWAAITWCLFDFRGAAVAVVLAVVAVLFVPWSTLPVDEWLNRALGRQPAPVILAEEPHIPAGSELSPAGGAIHPSDASPTAMVIANTDGQGAWVRSSPTMADRLIAWPEGTTLTVIGEPLEAEGEVWRRVVDPRGNQGFLPAKWLAPAGS